MTKFNIGDKVTWVGFESYGVGEVITLGERGTSVRFENYQRYDDTKFKDCHTPPETDLRLVEEGPADSINPNHYTRLKALTGVETWDILDFVAGDDPDMWNLGKYWFRMGHKEGQSTLTEKRKMLKYLERSIAKEEAAE